MARFFLADLRTGRQILDLPVLTGTWSVPLNGPGTVEATLNLQDPDIVALGLDNTASTAKTILGVVEHGVVPEAGPIWVRSYDRDAQTVSLSAKGVWSYFDHRYILPLLAASTPVTQFVVPDPSDPQGVKTMPNPSLRTSYSDMWLGTIAKRLVQQARAWTGGNLPIVFMADEIGVNTRTWDGVEFKLLGEALRQLTNVEGGPDIRFAPRITADGLGVEWVLHVGTKAQPLIASPQVQTWDLTAAESGITHLVVEEDASAIASLAWATGGRSEDTVLVSRANDSHLVDVGYPLFETLDSSHSDVVLQPTLDAYANENALYGRGPIEVWSFTAEIEGVPAFGSYGVGDFVDLVVGQPIPGYTNPGEPTIPDSWGPPPAPPVSNLAINPSFEADAGEGYVRENLALYPKMRDVLSGWITPTGMNYIVSATASGYRVEFGDARIADVPVVYSVDETLTTPGERFSGRMKISAAASNGGPQTFYLVVFAYGAGGIIASSGLVTVQPGQTVEAHAQSFAATISGVSGVRLILYNGSVGRIGDAFVMSGALLEARAKSGTYFDGDTLAAGDFTYGWRGAANATASLEKARTVANVSTAATIAACVRSSEWSDNRGYSLRIVPLYFAQGSAYVDVAMSADAHGLERGVSYTLDVTFWQPAPSGVAVAAARSVALLDQVGTALVSTRAADVAGAQRLRLNFTIPSAGGWYLRLYNGGGVGDPSVWWDSLSIVKAETSVPSGGPVRTNYALNPAARTSAAWYSNSGTVWQRSFVNVPVAHPLGLTRAAEIHRIDATASPIAASLYNIGYDGTPPVSRYVSVWVYTASTNMQAGPPSGTAWSMPIPASTWTLVRIPIVVGPGQYSGMSVSKQPGFGNATATDLVYFTGALSEPVAGGNYFDGATPDVPPTFVAAIDYAWTGAADASISTATPGNVLVPYDGGYFDGETADVLSTIDSTGVDYSWTAARDASVSKMTPVGVLIPGHPGTPDVVVPARPLDPFLKPGTYRHRVISLAGNEHSTTVEVRCAPGR